MTTKDLRIEYYGSVKPSPFDSNFDLYIGLDKEPIKNYIQYLEDKVIELQTWFDSNK